MDVGLPSTDCVAYLSAVGASLAQILPQINLYPSSPPLRRSPIIFPLFPHYSSCLAKCSFGRDFLPTRGGTGHLGRSSAHRASQLSSAWPWVLPATSSAYDASANSFILAQSFPTRRRRGLPYFYTQTCHTFAHEDAPLLCSDLHHGYKACLE